MVHKIKICTSTCPYCGNPVSRDYHGPEKWGLKYGRCNNCKMIFRTGKKLYSDLSPEEREADKKELTQGLKITIPVFLISLAVTCATGWELLGLIVFFSFLFSVIFVSAHLSKARETLMKYDYLKTKDPELYQLEYAESMRIIQKREIHNK